MSKTKSNAKVLKKIFLILITLFCLATSMLPSGEKALAKNKSDPYYAKIKKRGYLIVGLSADYAPMEFHTTINGQDQIVGSDIDLAHKIAKDLGVRLEIKEMNFDTLIGALTTGKIDMSITGMTDTPEREKVVSFSKPYYYESPVMLVKKSDQNKYKTVTDFAGQSVGVQKQTTQETLAENQLTSAKIVSVSKLTDVIAQLSANKVAGVVAADVIAKAYAGQNDQFKVINPKFAAPKMPIAIAMPKNAALLKSKVDSSVGQVLKHHLYEGYLSKADKLMFANNGFFAKYGMFFVNGAVMTLLLAAIGIVIGSILGTLIAILKRSKFPPFSAIARVYIEFLRGTPVLAQVYLVYYGTKPLLNLDVSAFTAGAIALSLNSAAYVAEIIRAGLQSLPQGQTEAARSLGLSRSQAMRSIILPQAIKNILPALGNEFVSILKESSVVSVIGAAELMFQASVVSGATFKPFLPIVIVSIIYFILTFVISRSLNHYEKKIAY